MSFRKITGIILFAVLFAAALNVSYAGLPAGERLTYRASFLYVIPVGNVSLAMNELNADTKYGNAVISCEARTAGWISLLFKAEAALNSYIDSRKFYPYKFEQVLKVAGKPDDVRRATYDRLNNIMEAEGKGKKKVPADVRDPLSAIYFLRAQQLTEGMEIKQMVNNNQSTYVFDSKVTGKKKIGRTDCWVLESKIRRENKSMYHSMDATIYVSDDAAHVPVLIKAKTKVGPVSLRLAGKNQ